MKLWFVIYIFGKVAASIGPLPYEMDECLSRKAEKEAEFDTAFAEKPGLMRLDGKVAVRTDVTIACLEQPVRPPLAEFTAP